MVRGVKIFQLQSLHTLFYLRYPRTPSMSSFPPPSPIEPGTPVKTPATTPKRVSRVVSLDSDDDFEATPSRSSRANLPPTPSPDRRAALVYTPRTMPEPVIRPQDYAMSTEDYKSQFGAITLTQDMRDKVDIAVANYHEMVRLFIV